MRAYTTILFTLIIRTVFCQSNGGFESNDVDGCRNQTGPAFTVTPFNQNKVTDWKASHGSPQIQRVGCPSTEADVHSGTEAAFLSFTPTNKEGIFQEINIKKDESFNVSVYAKGANSKIMVKFTNGLVNTNGNNAPNIPNPASQQLVIEKTLTNAWQEVRVDEIIADADYSQVWIYAMDGTILVDDFSFYKSCCEPYKLWQNITNPPSTYVNNYIKAGENVDALQPQGKVVIKENAGLVEFQAGKNIELLPGFETETGATFVAEIKDCGEKEFTLTVEEIPLRYSNSDPVCYKRFQASACFGSGDYTYFWSSSSGEDVSYPYDETTTTDIPLDAPRWIFAKVLDNLTGDTLAKGIYLGATPFSGDFAIDLYDIITPDGNGINDEWYAIDSTKLGSDSFGYNAFKYEMWIYDTWGQEIHHSSGENKATGFAYNGINWLDDYCNITTSITVFGVLDLYNCFKEETLGFSITLMCPASQPFTLKVDIINALENNVLVFPNPSDASITVESKIRKIKMINILEGNGKMLYQISNSSNLEQLLVDISDLSSGVYKFEIEFNDGERIIRSIIKR